MLPSVADSGCRNGPVFDTPVAVLPMMLVPSGKPGPYTRPRMFVAGRGHGPEVVTSIGVVSVPVAGSMSSLPLGAATAAAAGAAAAAAADPAAAAGPTRLTGPTAQPAAVAIAAAPAASPAAGTARPARTPIRTPPAAGRPRR